MIIEFSTQQNLEATDDKLKMRLVDTWSNKAIAFRGSSAENSSFWQNKMRQKKNSWMFKFTMFSSLMSARF